MVGEIEQPHLYNYTVDCMCDVYEGVCMNSRMMKRILGSHVPRPPPVLCFRFAFSIIHGSGKAAFFFCVLLYGTQTKEQKQGRPGNEARIWGIYYKVQVLYVTESSVINSIYLNFSVLYQHKYTYDSLVPRPPLFFVLWFNLRSV